ncbi:MAG: glycosyltransferase family 4 protein [Planctomycetota bacterium]
MKVAFLTNIISPYRSPVFQSLAKTEGWDLRVYVNSQTEFDRNWSGDCEGVDVVASKSWARKITHVVEETDAQGKPCRIEQVTTRYVPVGLLGDLCRFRPDVVITHEIGPRSFLASLWARMFRRPLVLWSYQARTSADRRDGFVRRKVRSFVFRKAGAVLGMGVQARDVLRKTGCPEDKILDAPNATDERMILSRAAAARQNGTVARIRSEVGEGKKTALVVGRLLQLKGVGEVLDAWSALPDTVRDEWRLVFLGDGPMRDRVESLSDRGIVHVPEVPMDEVANYMAAADAHLFFSFVDVWGLTVNEAMLCGLPTMCSILAGCAEDTVQDGVNGLLFDPRDRDETRAKLLDFLTREDLDQLGERAFADGQQFTCERLADGFRRAVDLARRNKQPRLAPQGG